MFSVNTSGPAPSLALHLSQLASGPLKVDYYNMVRGQQHPMVLYNNSVQMKLQISPHPFWDFLFRHSIPIKVRSVLVPCGCDRENTSCHCHNFESDEHLKFNLENFKVLPMRCYRSFVTDSLTVQVCIILKYIFKSRIRLLVEVLLH